MVSPRPIDTPRLLFVARPPEKTYRSLWGLGETEQMRQIPSPTAYKLRYVSRVNNVVKVPCKRTARTRQPPFPEPIDACIPPRCRESGARGCHWGKWYSWAGNPFDRLLSVRIRMVWKIHTGPTFMPARNLTTLDTTNMQSTEPRRIRQSYMLELGGGVMGRRVHGALRSGPATYIHNRDCTGSQA